MRDDYTDDVVRPGDPLSFEEFVLRCARSDPHLRTLQFEELQTTLPRTIEPDDEVFLELRRLEGELARLERVDVNSDELRSEHKRTREQKRAENEWALSKATEADNRLRQMFGEACAWEPPTSEHRWLKQFMICQLEQALRDREEEIDLLLRAGGDKFPDRVTYLEERIGQLRRTIDVTRAMYGNSVANAIEATRWVQQLRASVGSTPPG